MSKKNQSTSTLRLLLGDQLDQQHSWFESSDDTVVYLLAELPQETQYVRHHEQKICGFFLAMERFAHWLDEQGHRVHYLTLDDSARFADLPALLAHVADHYDVSAIEYQRPDEYRLARQLEQYADGTEMAVKCVESEHFLVAFDELPDYFDKDRPGKMETFYRKMRVRYDVLMDGDDPVGGKWNYDAENRKKFKRGDISAIPATHSFDNDVAQIRERLETHGVERFGHCEDQIGWPVTAGQAAEMLDYFCEHGLPHFGQFQDAMTDQADERWGLYHSRLSFALNAKLIRPMQVIDRAVKAYQQSSGSKDKAGSIDIAQVEGFVRQVLGWREYVRGVYWTQMPGYAEKNSLKAQRRLPAYFWDGDTHMKCLQHSLGQSLDNAYAHHIQRLMVIGNFCLLTGIDPDEVDAWYLGVYVDAIEWVEMPNTRGMSQFADGGLVATKPYASGGNYINKMSDYCRNCHYQQKLRVGDDACPFNAWYWHFMDRHRDRLEDNPRIGMIYRTWDKMHRDDRKAIIAQAKKNLSRIGSL